MHPQKLGISFGVILVRLIAVKNYHRIFLCSDKLSLSVTEGKSAVSDEHKQNTVIVITAQVIVAVAEEVAFAKDVIIKLFRKDRV
jgi:hypothetical protein